MATTLSLPPFRLSSLDSHVWLSHLVENVSLEAEFTLSLHEILREGEADLTQDEFIERMRSFERRAGLLHAQCLKALGYYGTPAEWNDFILLFPGTIWEAEQQFALPYTTHSPDVGWQIRRFWTKRLPIDYAQARVVCLEESG